MRFDIVVRVTEKEKERAVIRGDFRRFGYIAVVYEVIQVRESDGVRLLRGVDS